MAMPDDDDRLLAPNGEVHDDHGGWAVDRPHLVARRRALLLLGGAGLAGALAACSSTPGAESTSGAAASSSSTSPSAAGGGAGSTSSTLGSSTSSGAVAAAEAGAPIPPETAGPFPADGSNGPNVLTDGAVVRRDLTTSFGDFAGTADGIPMTLELTVVRAADGSPLAGAAVYAWHCTAAGQYSIYEVEDQNYLRGVQAADDAGRLTFTSVFPGCYPGRWPHVHFEVYESLDEVDRGADAVRTSQLAFPEADCEVVYADGAYGASAGNLSRLSLARDGVFADGWTDQLATVRGSNADGYTASLLVRV